MLGTINPQTIKIDQRAVTYPGRDHVTTLTIKRFDGRSYRAVDTSALTRVVLVFPDTDPTIAYDSDTLPAVFDWTGSTITIDLSDYAMPASSLPCYLIAFDAEHPAGQVLVDNEDTTLEFDFRNISTTGTTPAPAVEFITDAPIDGETYGRKDGAWVTLDAIVSGVVSVNGQTGVVNLSAADVGADPAGEAAAEVALHEAALDPHPQYTTAAEAATAAPVQSVNGETGAVVLDAANVGADASGAAAAAVVAHVGEADPHTQYLTQTEGDARYESGLVAGTNVTIDRTNPAAPVISAAGGGGGAVDSVNGQTGTVVLDADDIAEGATNHYYPAADESKLAGIESGAQVNVATDIAQSTRTATTVLITSSTGADATLTAASPTEAGLQSAADKTKLDGVATGATANSSDATLLARANHTGTQAASTISDFASAARAQTEAELIAGTNVTITPAGSGATRTLTIAAAGGGGGATLPVVQALSSTRNLVLADINTFNVNSTGTDYTVTIQPQSSVTWTADAEIHFLPSSTGDIVITAGAGVSLNGVVAGSITLSTAFGAATIKRIASDSWWLGGVAGQTGASGDWCAAGGTANTYTLTPVVARESYVTGDQFRARFSVTNTGATTVNVSGLGAKTCLTVTGAALPAGYIRTDADTVLSYDGTNFVVDRLVERGSNANGDYIRWASGELFCSMRNIGTADTAVAVGSLFRSTTDVTWTYPATFLSTPIVAASAQAQSRLTGCSAGPTTAAARQYNVVTSASLVATDFTAEGFWY